MIRWIRKGVCCLIPVIVLPSMLLAQSLNESGNPFLVNWSPKDYRGGAQNWAIVQDHRGVMYFGNSDGVLEYDGVTWRLSPMPNRSMVRSLALDPHGRIYVGAEREFGYLLPDSIGMMQYVSLIAHIPAQYRDFNEVWNTIAARHGVYFRTDKYLFRWRSSSNAPQGDLHVWTPETSFHRAFLVGDRLYVRQRIVGLMEISGDSLRSVSGGERFADEPISAMLPLDRARMLIGTRTQGLLLYDGATFQPFHTEADAFLVENQLYDGAVLADGSFAFATLRGGVAIIDHQGRLRQSVNRAAGLKNDMVGSLYPDREGGLWLGLDNGLARVETPSPLSLYAEPSGIRGSVEDIVRHRGQLYAATAQGVYFLSSPAPRGKMPVFQPVSGIATQSWSLLSGNNTLLAATNDGVFRIEENRATQRVSDLSAFVLYSSRQDSNRVYVGLEEGLGLLLWTNDSWRLAGHLSGLIGRVRSIAEDEEGTLWLGTESQSVLRVKVPSGPWGGALDHSTSAVDIAHFTGEHGIPPGNVYTVFLDQQVRIATTGGLRYFDRRSQSFLPDSTFGATFADTTRTIGHIIEDPHGRVIIRGSNQNGVVVAMAVRQEDGTYAVNAAPFRQVSEYGLIWASYADTDDPGVVWFGSEESILRYDPAVIKDYAVEYAALVRRVTVNLKGTGADSVIFGGTLAYGGELSSPSHTLRYADNALRFEFAAPSYGGASKIQFQVFLEGFDKSWSEWSDESRKYYTNLPAADYRFRVRAKNGYEHLSREAVYQLTILPPWWRTWWAYTLYGLFLVAFVFAVDRVQRQRLVRKERDKAFLREKDLRAEAAEHLANYLRSENQRQTQELEQARQLQLSMLPKTLPTHPTVEVGAYMKTAAEVGGDYYDFDLAEDGTLTVVIGDATGHGVNAGMVVTATKSALQSLVHEPELPVLVAKMNRVLRRLNLRKIYMALTILRIQDKDLVICAVGMPPVLIYRSASGCVEEVRLTGMPLGSVAAFPYQTKRLELSVGDVIVMMTDGFPERFNEDREMLGYEEAGKLLNELARKTPEEIIQHLVHVGDAWGGTRAQDDDVTFIVMKVKAETAMCA